MSKKNVRIVTAMLVVATIGFLAVYLQTEKRASPHPVAQQAPSAEDYPRMAGGAYEFVLTSYADGMLYLDQRCPGGSSNCIPETEAPLSAQAWTMLADAQAFQALGRAEAKQHMLSHFAQWWAKSDYRKEVYSLHQVAESYFATREQDLLFAFMSRIDIALGDTVSLHVTNKEYLHPMLLATMARQAAQAAKILDDEKAVKILSELPIGEALRDSAAKDRRRSQYHADSRALLTATDREIAAAAWPRMFEGNQDISYMSCWPLFALSAMVEVDPSTENSERIERELKLLNTAFSSSTVRSDVPAQALLPCVHAANELAPKYPEAQQLRQSSLKALTRYVDSGAKPGCGGTGGVSSERILDECKDRKLSVVDSSWFAYVAGFKAVRLS